MAILTTAEFIDRVEDPTHEFDFDDAQTVASWWYSPVQPALVALATAGKVLPSLEREIELEIECVEKDESYGEKDIRDLCALLTWAQQQDENDSEED